MSMVRRRCYPAINYCTEHELYSATNVKDTLEYLTKQTICEAVPAAVLAIKPVTNPAVAAVITQKRSVNDYAKLGNEVIR